MSKTKIGWTEEVWNPVTGCTKVSAGCKNCYAEQRFKRFKWHPFNQVTLHEDRLTTPLHWKKSRMVFVNSMSDLFHEDVPEEFIARILQIVLMCPQHTFQVLTKRPARMYELMTDGAWKRKVLIKAGISPRWETGENENSGVLANNLWLGVSVENQEQAMKRIPYLLTTPAALRWLSVEPMLGPVDFFESPGYELFLDWIVVGGESGHSFRQMEMVWLETKVLSCRAAGVPVFVKQDSGRFPGKQGRIPDRLWIHEYPLQP